VEDGGLTVEDEDRKVAVDLRAAVAWMMEIDDA
jgi:hypothetical protein